MSVPINNEERIKELLRLYELAEHQKDKAGLLDRIRVLEIENAKLRTITTQRTALEQGTRDDAPQASKGPTGANLEGILSPKQLQEIGDFMKLGEVLELGPDDPTTLLVEKNGRILIPYSSVYALDTASKIAVFRRPGACICIDASTLRRMPMEDRVHIQNLKLWDGYAALSVADKLPSLPISGQSAYDHLLTLPSLESLDVSSAAGGARGASEIARLKQVPASKLVALNISFNEIGYEGAVYVSALANLTMLDISGNFIRDSGEKEIAQLKKLRVLHVRYNQLHTVEHLAALPDLVALAAQHNGINGDEIKHIVELRNLTSLNLGYNGIMPQGAAYISTVTCLERLFLYGNPIGDEGAEHLSKLKLTALDVRRCGIGDKGAEYISRMTSLRELDVRDNDITDVGKAALARLSNCRIHYQNEGDTHEK